MLPAQTAAPQTIMRQFFKFWAAGDIDEAMRFVADDAVYTLHISNDVLPIGGETVGRNNIEAAFRQVRAQFEYVLYRPYNFSSEDDVVRLRVEHMYRHRASGEMLTGNFRLVCKLRNGLLIRAEEYHDRQMVEAFLRMVGPG